MANTTEIKADALPDLDNLLQCPVCYEIPPGHIFQCNEGHHVCGRCKARLDLCPVCRSLFFGTRNYAMEELIASVRKLQAFKLGGKMTVTSTSAGSESSTSADNSDVVPVSGDGGSEEDQDHMLREVQQRAPPACKGLFRCLCCNAGSAERLPAGRLLNHLRYFHAPDLLEGISEGGEYVQAWQIPTVPGRIVIAVRVSDMGIFFLVIEINKTCINAWVSMAASPWVAHQFCYTLAISGNDREAIFSDCVWSVRSCEGSLKKRSRCLTVNGHDVRALTASANIGGKLVLRRATHEQVVGHAQPRAVLRVANRGQTDDSQITLGLEPLIQGLQDDVARLSRAFASLGRETDMFDDPDDVYESPPTESDSVGSRPSLPSASRANETAQQAETATERERQNEDRTHLSRNARRRMRQRLRAALDARPDHVDELNSPNATNEDVLRHASHEISWRQVGNGSRADGGPSERSSRDSNQNRTGKKKRRHRR